MISHDQHKVLGRLLASVRDALNLAVVQLQYSQMVIRQLEDAVVAMAQPHTKDEGKGPPFDADAP
jgi:hypothetical protein